MSSLAGGAVTRPPGIAREFSGAELVAWLADGARAGGVADATIAEDAAGTGELHAAQATDRKTNGAK